MQLLEGALSLNKTRSMRILIFVFIGIFSAIPSLGQIENIVFEGAGIRGLAYAGVVKELENRGVIQELNRVGGTSAGALTAALISLGYSGEEIEDLVAETNWDQFNDANMPYLLKGAYRLNDQYGWYKGRAFTNWMEGVIAQKTGNPDLTFAQAKQLDFPELYCTTVAVDSQELLVLSAETFPNMRIADAMRAAISIPFYFEAVPINSEGKVLDNLDDPDRRYLLIDGGMIANYPIDMFDQYEGLTVGFRMDDPEQIEHDQSDHKLCSRDVSNLKNYTIALYVMALENTSRLNMTEQDWQRTVSISSGNIGPMIKELSESDKSFLMDNGKKATGKWFDQCLFEN